MISMVDPAVCRIAQRADDLEPGRDAGDAVKTAARRHGVAVRSDRDHAKRGIAALEPADQVAGRIDAGCQSGLGKTLREPGAAFEKQRGERAPGIGPCRIGDLRQRHHIGPEAVGVERKIGFSCDAVT